MRTDRRQGIVCSVDAINDGFASNQNDFDLNVFEVVQESRTMYHAKTPAFGSIVQNGLLQKVCNRFFKGYDSKRIIEIHPRYHTVYFFLTSFMNWI